ncbi:MarR family winged helix-turn-helix transcriptional regulator [Frigidibacter oleivorans]|uniref:MarR family winged helix-turn-helix transcriptional regulator n=1 Tax=Frigidibacter oleivorans TaxID=2487129 RepID=UPI000F8F60BD|nr:MarR family transcriptional regulator [Frigidibacter oleivorans]
MTESPLLDALLQVLRELRRQYDTTAAEMGLTMSRARVLTTLARMEGATQAELAQELGIEAPTLKRQIDALDQDGFIERRGLDGDARKRALFLTDRGRSAEVTRFVERIRAEVLADISDEDQERTRQVLERIARNAARLRGRDGGVDP